MPNGLNIRLNQKTIARVLGAVGVLGIFIALLLYLAQRDITGAVLIALVVGIAGLSLWLALAPNDIRELFTPRRALYGGNSLLLSVLVIGSALVVYTLAASSNIVADMTAYRVYSLRPDVSALMRSLSQPLIITVFYTTAQLDQQSADQPVLNLFRDARPDLVKLNIIDPDQQPVVARNFGASSGAHAFITGVGTNGQPDLGTGKIIALDNDHVGEQQVADAILLFQARGKFKVLFTQGHSEVSVDSGGLATQIRAGLDKVGITTSTIDLSQSDIPTDTTALVLLAPKSDLTAVETQKIIQYTADGGRLLIMAHPLFVQLTNDLVPPPDYLFLQDKSPMSRYLIDTWGITPQNDIVYDPLSNTNNSPYETLTARALQHPIMAKDPNNVSSGQLQAVLYNARSWAVAPVGKGPPSVILYSLISSSDKAFGATDIRAVQVKADSYTRLPTDFPGPLVTAVAGENSINHSRIVVIGDVDWATNDVVAQFGNAQLWSNMMNWLTQYQEKTTVSPTITQLPLITDSATLNAVVVLTIIALPGLVLATGMLVWWKRVRA
jgi:hypothetical protein